MTIYNKWEKYWKEHNTYKVDIHSTKSKYYVLDMFPYPSGSGLHVGHPEGYTATDIIARYKKQKGFEVLHPMGFDSFGLPAEQYAIQTGHSPKEFTLKNIDNFKNQLNKLGFSYDWNREVITSEPWYYKHTQWIFAQLFKHGLAQIKDIEVNWSPSLNTVLANEEVIEVDGVQVSERDKKPVVKKTMKQWVLKITKYADKLFNGLENLDWPNSVKSLQKNWIYYIDDNGHKTMHLQDWIFARQRYWGEPFPIIHKNNGELYLIPEIEYPIKLPEISNYKFSQDGKPALSNATSWVKTEIGERDLNTMPQWAGSCWYYLAYILKLDNKNEIIDLNSPEAKKLLDKWLPVDLYVGGQEHAVLHLLYSRFWHIFLSEIGITSKKEPFQKLFNQGMILGPDGTKMSKSKGNVVNPDDIINSYGPDALRIYLMFMGPLESDKAWADEGIKSSKNWIERVERLYKEIMKIESDENVSNDNKIAFNKLIESFEKKIDLLQFNTCISDMMIFINQIYKDNKVSKNIADGFIQMLSLFAPYVSEEIWFSVLNHKNSIYNSVWPNKITNIEVKASEVKFVIQFNSKVRGTIMADKIPSLELSNLPHGNLTLELNQNKEIDKIINFLINDNAFNKQFANKTVKRIHYVVNKIINIEIE